MTPDALHIKIGFIEKYFNLNTLILNFLTTFFQLQRLLDITSHDSMLIR